MKRMLTMSALLIGVAGLAGCANNKWRADEAESFVNAQEKAIAAQKPLVSFEAAEGETIELKGVKKFEVYAPTNARVVALPQRESKFWGFAGKVVDRGMQYFGLKFGSDVLGRVFDSASSNAGDHSQTTFNIADSYNDESDQSQHGDTLVDSNVIEGPVEGTGAGIGTALELDESTHQEGDGSAFGNDNEIVNNEGEIRGESPGPIIDNSNDGDECEGSDCSHDEEVVDP